MSFQFTCNDTHSGFERERGLVFKGLSSSIDSLPNLLHDALSLMKGCRAVNQVEYRVHFFALWVSFSM